MGTDVKRRILQINVRYQRHSGGWVAMIVIGAIITQFALLGVVITYQNPVDQQIASIIIAVALGMSFIMGGAGNMARLKKGVREKSLNVLSTASVHATDTTNTEIPWSPAIPRPTSIPSSAFVSSPQGGSMQRPARIPSTAFIPQPRVGQGSSSGSGTRDVPKEISSPFQDTLGRICRFCGAQCPPDPETRFCPNCGHQIS